MKIVGKVLKSNLGENCKSSPFFTVFDIQESRCAWKYQNIKNGQIPKSTTTSLEQHISKVLKIYLKNLSLKFHNNGGVISADSLLSPDIILEHICKVSPATELSKFINFAKGTNDKLSFLAQLRKVLVNCNDFICSCLVGQYLIGVDINFITRTQHGAFKSPIKFITGYPNKK